MSTELKPHQQRVVQEKQELDEKIVKLEAFFGTDTYATLEEAEQYRLRRQIGHMTLYSCVLGDRIAAFQ